MVDPLQDLAHDHRESSELLIAIGEALARVDRGESTLEDEGHEIGDGIEALRDGLLEHFAREQEGLFPFVLAHLPGVSPRVDRMIAEHDRISEALTDLVRDWTKGPVDSWRRSLARFETLYAEHTKAELTFLEDVAASIVGNGAHEAQLRALLDAS